MITSTERGHQMNPITIEQVTKSYNGKTGCMCGCNGKYKLPSHVSIEDANKAIGYEGYDEEDVSDRSVKIAVNKINKALDKYRLMLVDGEYNSRDDNVNVGRNDDFAWFSKDGRNTVVYF